jgi:hypothetical protein
MSKAWLPRFHELRDVFRLVGECRDLGWDPNLWLRRAFEGTSRLIGAAAATGGEGYWLRPAQPPEPLTSCDIGFDERGRKYFTAFMREGALRADPIFRELQRVEGRVVTYRRGNLVSDREWYQSRGFNEYRKPGGIDHQLTSIYQLNDEGAISSLCWHRGLRERDFSARETALIHHFHCELGRLIGGSLVTGLEPGPEDLSPRLRETLLYLVQGDSEKQVAARSLLKNRGDGTRSSIMQSLAH